MPETFPTEIKELVWKYRKEVSEYMELWNNLDLFVPEGSIEENLINYIEKILEKYRILCFHVTRVLNKQSLFADGLGKNTCKEYLKYMKDVMSKLKIDDLKINAWKYWNEEV